MRDVETRLWSRVEKTGYCWRWKGPKNQYGYGVIGVGRRTQGTMLAHRLAYMLTKGEIPEGLTLDHLCRVRDCVNPEHLEPVTRKENNRRGNGFSGRNAQKTHCKNGHPLSGDNLIVRASGMRNCRTCIREYGKKRRQTVNSGPAVSKRRSWQVGTTRTHGGGSTDD